MPESVVPESAGRPIRDSIVVPSNVIVDHPTEPGTSQFEEEDEPEPMSFAPGRLRRASEAPPAPRHASASEPVTIPKPRESEFEAVSMRFRSMDQLHRFTQQRSVHDDALTMFTSTAESLRRRASSADSPEEAGRFTAFAESIDKLIHSDAALGYLREGNVSREIVAYLKRYKAAERQWSDVDDVRDVVLKASVTAIHLAPCLGYWRQNPNVPEEVQKLLTGENVFGSVFRIAKERKGRWVDKLLAEYGRVTGALSRAAGKHGPIAIKTRNPILWPWCKFNIKNVTYKFYRGDSTMAEAEDTIADVKLVLVLLNVLLDDIADSLQDEELLEIFLQIPFADGTFGVAEPEVYAGLREQLLMIGWPEFEEYFDLAVDCWRSANRKLKAIVGSAYDELRADYARDHELLISAMRFSVHLNNRPRAMFEMSAAGLKSAYGSPTFSDILAHNANRAVFFTIDAMCALAFERHRYMEMVKANAVEVYRENAWYFQINHQTCNSVATGARETGSDDLTNELFKIANDRLNSIQDWPLPENLARIPGFSRRDAVLAAFERKKALKRERLLHREGSDERSRIDRDYQALGEDIERLVEMSGADHAYFLDWLKKREEAVDVFYKCDEWLDRYSLVNANDLILVLHLTYKGRI